jgi:hypothetical protein
MDSTRNIKSKDELIEELTKNGFKHEFVFRSLTQKQKKKIIEFYVKNNLIKDDFVFSYLRNGFDRIALIVYDDKEDIIGLSFIQESIVEGINLSFFEFSYYVNKSYRLNGIKPSIVHKILYPLTYYESYDYKIQNEITNICGLVSRLGNMKIINKYMKRNCIFNDGYWSATYIGNNSYIWYYENAKF